MDLDFGHGFLPRIGEEDYKAVDRCVGPTDLFSSSLDLPWAIVDGWLPATLDEDLRPAYEQIVATASSFDDVAPRPHVLFGPAAGALGDLGPQAQCSAGKPKKLSSTPVSSTILATALGHLAPNSSANALIAASA